MANPVAPIVVDAAPTPADDVDELGDWLKSVTGKTVGVNDILDRARIEAGLEPEDMDKIPAIDRWDSPNGVRWPVHASPPSANGEMNGFITIAIFIGDQADRLGDFVAGEGRLYVMPRVVSEAAMTGAPDPSCPFFRYTFSRAPNSGGHRAVMGLRLFIEEIGRELTRMAVMFDVIEDDEDEDDE